ncbi:spore gernimation protein [Robertmurraya yapensis]|uniref:Spore gernimation protein n=1 Tax=Bacillus yapensis TaxID=2492960 RepID=A0A431W7W4_9BACI|nr:spore germination protein GerPC [Bacillus yapensis]RTR31487.1 spore gernimation protein [Bacillus yapensis]TKS95711.1 spore gernimation protein [Bacillus yapensis]
MNQDLYTYLQQMHSFIQSQEKRIIELEQKVELLASELEEVKSRHPIQVGTIEYKFDQLKVESLEGTLNIGLNPAEIEQQIEELELPNNNGNGNGNSNNNYHNGLNIHPKKGKVNHIQPKKKMQRSMDLEDSVFQYLETKLEPLIKKYEEQLGRTFDEPYVTFIKEDIIRQLPQRIEYYLKKIPDKERTEEAEKKIDEQLQQQMKTDIENAVLAFLKTLPKDDKDEPSSV